MIMRGSRKAGAVASVVVLALTLTSCSAARAVLKGALHDSSPIVRELPAYADDVSLRSAAVDYLSSPEVDQGALSAARELATSDEVQSIVSWSCNLSGFSEEDPADVVEVFQSVVTQTSGVDGLGILHNDAQSTVDSVRPSIGYLAMNGAGQLAVAVFQEVYC
jgi:hypothetical protein